MACKKCRKIQQIILGNISYITEELFDVQIFKSPEFQKRMDICLKCSSTTWMTKFEFLAHIHKYTITLFKNLGDFEKIPSLPKQGPGKNRKLICMICKCPIQSKARVNDSHCSLNKW